MNKTGISLSYIPRVASPLSDTTILQSGLNAPTRFTTELGGFHQSGRPSQYRVKGGASRPEAPRASLATPFISVLRGVFDATAVRGVDVVYLVGDQGKHRTPRATPFVNHLVPSGRGTHLVHSVLLLSESSLENRAYPLKMNG